MNDALQDDLTMAGHARMLARSADALWMPPHESVHGLASIVVQLADIVADLAGSLQARIDREDDLR